MLLMIMIFHRFERIIVLLDVVVNDDIPDLWEYYCIDVVDDNFPYKLLMTMIFHTFKNTLLMIMVFHTFERTVVLTLLIIMIFHTFQYVWVHCCIFVVNDYAYFCVDLVDYNHYYDDYDDGDMMVKYFSFTFVEYLFSLLFTLYTTKSTVFFWVSGK